MTDEVAGITPSAPGGLAAYALGSMAEGGWPEGASPRARPGYAQGSSSAQGPGSPQDPGYRPGIPGTPVPRDPGYPQNPGYPQHPQEQEYPQGQEYPQDPGYLPGPSPAPSSASPRPARPGGAAYPERPVHHQHQPSPDTPAVPPRGSRARRSGPVRGSQVAYVIVLAGLVAGLAYIWQGPHSVREGTFILAGALFVAVAARLALPERRAGMLASRRRYIDVTVLAILAIGLLVAGLVLPTPS